MKCSFKGKEYKPNNGQFGKKHTPWNKNKKMSIEYGDKIRKAKLGVRPSEETKRKMSKSQIGKHSGEKNWKWKDGISKDKVKYCKEWRHLTGISKRYNSLLGISYTKEYKKFHWQQYRALKKRGGELPIERIQKVYEDNIKKYGTLTCYLCEKLIQFGKDELEHKTPLSRGGTNEYKNLGIAHESCNRKKRDKTVEEFLLCA